MSDKELDLEDDDIDGEDDDLDLDDDVEEEGDQEDLGEEEEDEVEEEEEKKADPREEELSRLRKEREEWAGEREKLSREKDEADFKAFDIEQKAVKAAIDQWQNEARREKTALRELTLDLEEARLNQDADAVRKISSQIADRNESVEKLTAEINTYSPLLNRQPPAKTEVAVEKKQDTAAEQMARRWHKENSWYNDPAFREKRKKADEIYQKNLSDDYSPESIAFWTNLNDELKSFESNKTKRRVQPAFRPAKNINGASKTVTTKKKADAEVLAMTNQILDRRSANLPEKTDAEYKRIKKETYLSVQRQMKKDRKSNA